MADTDTAGLIARLRDRDKRVWNDLDEAAALIEQQQREIAELRVSVKEWACDKCNTVYPGPPQKGLACVMCPYCSGNTMPYAELKLRRAEGQVAAMREALRRHCVDSYERTAECGICGLEWDLSNPEQHSIDCPLFAAHDTE